MSEIYQRLLLFLLLLGYIVVALFDCFTIHSHNMLKIIKSVTANGRTKTYFKFTIKQVFKLICCRCICVSEHENEVSHKSISITSYRRKPTDGIDKGAIGDVEVFVGHSGRRVA